MLIRDLLTVSLLALSGAIYPSVAQAAEPYPRISREAFEARLPFFDHTPQIPLEARIVREWDNDDTLRQKIVFRGAQGFLVPGYLEFPKAGSPPYPLILLLHGWSGNKESWYEDGNMISGGDMRKALLNAGYATLALDAATHGERSNEIDYQHVNPHDDPNAPTRRNYFTFAEISIQTVKDYRRALDYLATRDDIDTIRTGLVGYSMGGMDAFYLLAVEPRINAAVACVPPWDNDDYDPTNPVDYTWGIGDSPFLIIAGRNDEMYDYDRVNATYSTYLERPTTKLVWLDHGHKLTEEYVPVALQWVREHLP